MVPCSVWLVQSSLDGAVTLPAEGRFHDVKVHFVGQEAVVSGRVDSTHDLQDALNFVKNDIRSGNGWWAGRWNPVASVRNELTLRPGFFLLLRQGKNALLAGETANDQEHDQLLQAVVPWLGEKAETLLFHTAVERVPASLAPTLESLKALPIPTNADPVLLAATLGEKVQTLDLSASEDTLNALFQQNNWPWELGSALPKQSRIWTTQAEEAARQMELPLPHVMLLAAGKNVYLRGEVATEGLKEAIIGAAAVVYKDQTLQHEIQVTDKRRVIQEAGETLSSFPVMRDASEPGVLAVATPGSAWRIAKLTEENFTPAALGSLNLQPEKVPASLLEADALVLSERHATHLKNLADMAAAAQLPASFLAILGVGETIMVRGEVSSEPVKQAVIKGVKQFYPTSEIQEEIRISSKRRPVTPEELTPLTNGLPVAAAVSSAGMMGFAVPGSAWTRADIPAVELRPEEFEEFVELKDLLPKALPIENIHSDLTAFISLISAHTKKIASLKLNQMPPQPYLAMLALGNQVVLRGDAGSAKLKKTVVDAAKQFYKGREIIDELRIDSNPPVVIKPGWSITTFPPAPAVNGPGVFGFNVPGQPWLQVPLTWDQPTLASLDAAGLFSKGFEPSQAWPDFESWLSKLTLRKKPETPAPSPKPAKP